MLAPERRTRRDLVIAAVLVIVLSIAATVAWLTGDAHGTTSVPAQEPMPQVAPALEVPATLSELWRAPSAATDPEHAPVPVTTGAGVVTADGGSVIGRDPRSGNESWSYTRDLAVCSVVAAWNTAVSVYRDDRGCSQVTELDGATGDRKAQRTSDADHDVYLSTDGTYVTSLGDTRMELWRSDMVRTLEYGRVDAPVNPGKQPRSGCDLLSTASTNARIAVLEQCPDEASARLTILNPAAKEASEPEEYGSAVVPQLPAQNSADNGYIIAAAGNSVALAIPATANSPARVALYDYTANLLSESELPAGIAPTSGDRPTSPAVEAASVFSWYTGSGIQAFDASDLRPVWSLPGALGAGAVMAGRLLVPVADAIVVIDPTSGAPIARIPVDRGDFDGPITMSVVGDVVVEQRGEMVVALG